MSYATIDPPFTLRFREMTRKDLVAYAVWFHQSAATRIAELTKAVVATSGFEKWEPDDTPQSLEALGRWFEAQVETRRLEARELAEAHANLAFAIGVPKEDLTNKTFSLAMDIGMYFARVVLKNLPGTRWEQPLGNKKFADFGQPVIAGFGTVPLNPVRVIVTTAYAISRGKPARLTDLYETWARMKR